jgi:hypothetical protein
MLTVACVLKSGGHYNAKHVRILESMVSRHLIPDRFVCLTDDAFASDRIECVRLRQGWPGWWSKMELYSNRVAREGSRVLYFDLDVVITGDLGDLARAKEPFIVVGDAYRRGDRSPRHLKGRIGYQSSIMAWNAGELEYLYDDFARTAYADMARHRHIGDQEFLEFHGPRAAYWEDVLPGQVVSYKRNCIPNSGELPACARVVDFHGRRKPWMLDTAWISEHYRIAERP